MPKFNQQLVKELKFLLDSAPQGQGMYSHGKDGSFLAELFEAAGYGLELHQAGIAGTVVLGVKLN